MWIYKMHFMENGEFFEYDTYGGQGSGAAQKAFPYLESLLSFLEMSREEWEPIMQQASENLDRFLAANEMANRDRKSVVNGKSFG